MPLPKTQLYMSEQDYLDGELLSDIKHEYIDGEVYAIAGAHRNYVLLADTITRKFGNHLKNKPCQPYSSDIEGENWQQIFLS